METRPLPNKNATEMQRAADIFREHQHSVYQQTDRIFSILLPVQWLAGIIAVYILSPLTWSGVQSGIHPHLWFAIFGGGLITSLPLILTLFYPGEKATRYVVAVSQMLMSGLLIHVTGGRIETHFHIFGSLAFLACYRDWRVLIPATIIAALDHFVRGWLYPFSIYGTLNSGEWRWFEHIGWVIFTDTFLIISCLRSVREMREIAVKTAATNSGEERYRTVIEQMTESVFLLEPEEFRVIECNEAFAKLLGCQNVEEAKTLYASDFDAMNPGEIQMMTTILRAEKKSMSAERRYLRRDGSWINVEITGRYINYNDTDAFCVNARDITERKQTQIELKKLALVAEKTQNAVVITDTEGKITWVNNGFTRITGYLPEEVIGHKPGNFLQGENTDRETAAAIHDAIVQQKPFEGEIYNYGKNGNGYWLSLSIMPITNKKGDLKGFIAVEMDITERKAMEVQLQLSYDDMELRVTERTAALVEANERMRAEAAERECAEAELQNSRDYLNRIINTVADPIFVIDSNHCVVLANSAFCQMLGRTYEDTLGRNPDTLFPHEKARLVMEANIEILKSGKETIDEEHITDQRGNPIVILTKKSIYEAPSGEKFIVGVIHDITENKRVEEVLQNSRDYLDQIINAVADPIFVMNRQHQMTLVNDAMCQFIGLSREETLGRTGHELSSVEEADVFWEKDELVFTSGEENINEEQFTDPQGNLSVIITRKRLHIDKNGEQFIVAVSRDITENKRIEEVLQAGETMQRQLAERQSAILDALPAHICLLDQSGNILEVNNEWKQFAVKNGYHGNNFGIGSNYIETCENATGECAEGAKQAAEICRAILAGETSHFEMEYPCHSPNQKRWFKLTVNALHKDKFAGAVVMHVNITERKLAEEAMQNSRDYLDRIMNAVSSPIFVKNRKHEMTMVNEAMCQFMKRSREDSIGKSDHDFFPAEEADVYRAKDELVFASKKENINEERLTDTDGNTHVIVTKKRLHIDKDGAEYIVGVINDITELKRVEHKLIEAKHFLRTVINNVPSLIFVKDIAGNFVLANQALADIFGTTTDNLIGKTDADFSHNPEEARKFTEEDIQTLQNLEEKHIPEEQHTDANGEVHWFQTIKRSVLFEENGARYLIGVATDFTERKIMESQLRHSQKMESIGQLAAGIAHEINTPTQYVNDNTRFVREAFTDFNLIFSKYGELLDSAQAGEIKPELISEIKDEIESADFEYLIEEVPKAIQQSLDGVTRIAKIVQSMKDFAHPGSREKQSADLNRAIESTVTVARNEWKYVAEIETHFDPNLPLVPCFLGEFNQVVLNMVINAAHAISDVVNDGSQGKGKITITTTKVNNDWAEVRIGDTGNGIPPEIRGKIFDPFFTTKEVGKGTGQGLAISHTVVVDKHHGQLNFETEIGHGTTFIIRLPLDSVRQPE